jgi:choline kinase
MINLVVGFKKDLIMESFPNLTYVYNQYFDQTNTAKSLLKAIKKLIFSLRYALILKLHHLKTKSQGQI